MLTIPSLENYHFQKTQIKNENFLDFTGTVSMSFDNVPFGVAMSNISAESGVTIVWGLDADETVISGVYTDVSISQLLLAISRRYNMQLVNLGEGVFFIGVGSRSDIVSLVVRSPSSDVSECVKSLEGCCSEFGRISSIGNCILVSDYLDQVKKIHSVCEKIRENSSCSYVAEVYFLRMKNSDLLDLQARLEAKNVDLFSTPVNIKNLFSMYLEVTGTRVNLSSETRPILYLSEGREGIFQVGTERVREIKAVSSEGYVSTTSFESITDGMNIRMKVNKHTSDFLSCDFDLSISSFGENDENGNPVISKSALSLPGILVRDTGVYFLGCVKKKEDSSGLGILSMNLQKNDELITVWLKIREFDLRNKEIPEKI